MLGRYQMVRGARPPNNPLPVGVRKDTRKHTLHILRPDADQVRSYLDNPGEAAWERFAADYGLATSGISGPGGGTAEKPVGLVHVALARAEGTHSEHFVFPLDRTRHRLLTTQVALDWVRRAALGVELIGPSLMRRRGGGPPPAR